MRPTTLTNPMLLVLSLALMGALQAGAAQPGVRDAALAGAHQARRVPGDRHRLQRLPLPEDRRADDPRWQPAAVWPSDHHARHRCREPRRSARRSTSPPGRARGGTATPPTSRRMRRPGSAAATRKRTFIQTIRTGKKPEGRDAGAADALAGVYGKMTDDDLKAVYAYLTSLRPVKNVVRAAPVAGTR